MHALKRDRVPLTLSHWLVPFHPGGRVTISLEVRSQTVTRSPTFGVPPSGIVREVAFVTEVLPVNRTVVNPLSQGHR